MNHSKSNPYFVFLIFFLLSFVFQSVFASDINYRQTTKPRISAGAEFMQAVHKGQINLRLQDQGAIINYPPNKLLSVNASPQIFGPVTESINYAHDDSLNGWGQTPPDNAGCVGPDHFILSVNSAVEWYTKSGRTRQYSKSLNDFFAPTNPTDLFDPRVLYDQYNGRYVIFADEEDDNSKISFIHFAISKTSDPNDGWYFQKINTKKNISGNDTWLDFPCLGISSEALYLSGNMFTFGTNTYQATRLWIIDKGLYNGNDTSAVNVYDPSTEAGLGSQAFTIFPAHMYGTQPAGVGNFMFSSEWDDNNGHNDLIALFRIDDPLGSSGGPLFSVQFLNPGEIHNNSAGVPEAPQKDSNINIDFGDDRAQSCIWRDGAFVGAFTVNPSSGSESGQATNFWFTVNTTNLAVLDLDQQGFIGGEDIAEGTSTAYPAVTMNANGDIGIGFSATAATIYAGSYFAIHQVGDPSGSTQNAQLMHAGLDYYVRTGLPIHVGNRWGDYSSIALDPTEEESFWVFNQYAWTRGNYDSFAKEDGRWATSFAQIEPNGNPSAVRNLAPKQLPYHFSLEQNYPNPFNPTTAIRYRLPVSGRVNLTVYDALGQKVKELVNSNQNRGPHRVVFDAGGLASGVYICKLSTSNGSRIRKMILLR